VGYYIQLIGKPGAVDPAAVEALIPAVLKLNPDNVARLLPAVNAFSPATISGLASTMAKLTPETFDALANVLSAGVPAVNAIGAKLSMLPFVVNMPAPQPYVEGAAASAPAAADAGSSSKGFFGKIFG
jgi:hypothetical protein